MRVRGVLVVGWVMFLWLFSNVAWASGLILYYDSSPMSEANRSPSLPLGSTWRGAAGVQYDWSQNLTLGFAYEYINLGSANINKTGNPLVGFLLGDYSPNMINLNLIYRF